MQKPVPMVVYVTSDDRQHPTPQSAAKHELHLQVQALLDRANNSTVMSRFELLNFLCGDARHKLADVLSYDYTPKESVLADTVITDKLPKEQEQVERKAQAQTPFGWPPQTGPKPADDTLGMSDSDLLKAIQA